MDNEEEDEATAGRAEEGRDRVYVDGKGGVENLLLVELGVGHVSCLLDLFLLDHGPGLRYYIVPLYILYVCIYKLALCVCVCACMHRGSYR
jgi:hypothetical protein